MSKASDFIRSINIGSVGGAISEIIVPENVECLDDLQYGPDPVWNLFDIYYETSNEKKHPTLISIHGGAWVSNTKESYRHYCLDLAKRGFNVVNCTFRLAPENQHPAMIEDIAVLVNHLIEKKEEYGLDMDNTFMVGDSAGAHMLCMYTSICTDPEYAGNFPFVVAEGFIPKGIALNHGVYNVYKYACKGQDSDRGNTYLDYVGYENNEENLRVTNAIDFVNANFPPVYLVTSSADVFQDQYALLLAELEKYGIKNVHRNYGDEENKLPHVFHLTIDSPDAIECNDDQCNFFRSLVD